MVELHDRALNLISKKFNILFSIDCRDFDLNFSVLEELIKKIKRDKFSHEDRIILVHMDNDYYDPLLPCGLLIINLVRTFKKYNIPLYLMLFVTNHYGIKKEFDFLLKDHSLEDRPTVIETLLSNISVSTSIELTKLNLDSIEKPAICMMGRSRSHRVALCNYIKNNNLLDKIALQTNFNLS